MRTSSASAAVRRTVGVAVVGLVLALAPATAAYAAVVPVVTDPGAVTEYTPVDVTVSAVSEDGVSLQLTLNADGVAVGTLVSSSCAGSPLVCQATYTWVPTTTDPVLLTATATDGVAAPVTGSSLEVTPIAAPPQVVITPKGTTVSGVQDVKVTASTGAAQVDEPMRIDLLRGSSTIDTFSCSPGSSTCEHTFTDVIPLTAAGASYTITAKVTTALKGDPDPRSTVRTQLSSETFTTPAPQVTVAVTPVSGSTVKGVVTITATATVDPALTDAPTSLTLPVLPGTVTVNDAFACSPATTCTQSWTWDTTGQPGAVDVTATAKFANSADVTSNPVKVTVSSPTPSVTVAVTPVSGSTVKGVVTITATATVDPALTDAPTALSLPVLPGSVTVKDAFACSPATTCTQSWTWDTTGQSGGVDVIATGSFAKSVTRASNTVSVTVVTPAPTESVAVAPISGSVIKGVVTITATATVDSALSDTPTSLTLGALPGKVTVKTAFACSPSKSCTKSWTWDTTGLFGSRAITVTAQFTKAATRSTTKNVTVANPLPSVALVSPSSSTVITKTTTVKLSASTDSSTSDFPKTLQMLVNGVVKATKSCATTVHSCAASFSWSPGTLDGPQAFSARVTTLKGAVRTSSVRTYYAYYRSTSSTTSISSLTTVVSGTKITVKGKVIANRTGAGVAGITVRITRDPAIGTTATTPVTTSSSGAFSFTFTARYNTTVAAQALPKTYNGSTWFSGSSRTARQLVQASFSCTILDTTLNVGQTGQGSCTVPDLPVGTPLTLTYTIAGRTTTLASGSSKSTTINFSFVFPAAGTYTLKVNLSANRVFTATSSPGLSVTQA